MANNYRSLGEKLKKILGSPNVYFQPPPSIRMKYPCIVYAVDGNKVDRANNTVYRENIKYRITVIYRTAVNPIHESIIRLPYCSYDRPYISDNLYHDVYTIYY